MREIFEGYYCLLDNCNKDLIDNQPPCCECENIISFEEFAEMQQDIQDRFLKNKKSPFNRTMNVL